MMHTERRKAQRVEANLAVTITGGPGEQPCATGVLRLVREGWTFRT